MESKRSEAVRDHWHSMTKAARANPDQSPEEVRERVERYWPALTAEPGGIDYLEVEVAGLPASWVVPKGSAEDRVIFSVHGGGGVSGSIYTHRKLFGHLAKAVGARALLTEYRQAQHPVPLEDTTAAYRWLLAQGVDARHIAVVGDSLGGNLSISTLLRPRELGLPAAAALMLLSPWVDLTVSNETFETNRESEAFFYKEVVGALAAVYLGGADPKDPAGQPGVCRPEGPSADLHSGGRRRNAAWGESPVRGECPQSRRGRPGRSLPRPAPHLPDGRGDSPSPTTRSAS